MAVPGEDDLAGLRDVVDLEDILGHVEANRGGVHGVAVAPLLADAASKYRRKQEPSTPSAQDRQRGAGQSTSG